MRVQHGAVCVQHTGFFQLSACCGDPLLVAHAPHVIAFSAEIFEPQKYRAFRIANHIRGPVVKHLDAAQMHTFILHVDPAIRHNVAKRFELCFVADAQFIHKQADGHKIAVGKTLGDFLCKSGCIRNACHKIADGHGADDDVR